MSNASIAGRQRPDSAVRTWSARTCVLATAVLVACGGAQDTAVGAVEEDGVAATGVPVDDGRRQVTSAAGQAAVAAPGFIPTGDPNAQTQGVFGPVVPLPLMPIHEMLLPDGRVLFYGSDVTGEQGGGLHYAVWDPTLGTGDAAFTVLPTVTATNLFCAGQALLPDTGDPLIIGGTTIVDGLSDYGVSDVNRFDRAGSTLVAEQPMAFRRWYPTLLTLASGDQVALGGRMDRTTTDGDTPAGSDRSGANPADTVATYAHTPEVWSRAAGWRTLTGADSDEAFGSQIQSWYYPRSWVDPRGNVFVIAGDGHLFMMDTTGIGALTAYTATVPSGEARLQAVMYQPGKILALRSRKSAVLIDVNGKKPVVKTTPMSSRMRLYGNATLLADGQLWLSGGSSKGNELTNDFLVSEMWNPATQAYTDMATATVVRLYHSSALMLPDGTVMTGGGGDPGPVTNLNAEIYYPPYLYLKDGSGTPAPRPTIVSAPDVLGWGASFTVKMGSSDPVSRATLVRTGVVTHNFDSNQRFQELVVKQNGAKITLKTPANSGLAPPGFYLLFVFDANGVPSVAKTFRIGT